MKRILVLAVALFFLVGCGASGNMVQGEPVETIKIGSLLPLTGVDSDSYGVNGLRGITMAMDEINAKGGIDGKKLEIIVEDSMANPTQAIKAFQSLQARGVPAVIGDITVVTLYVAPFAEQSKTVLLAPGSAVPKLREMGDYVFRLKVAGDVEAFESAKGLIQRLDVKKAAMLIKNTEYGIGIAEAFDKKFEELGGEITNYEKYETGEGDFRTYLMKIKQKEPDALFLVCYPEECGMIVKQTRELGMNIPLVINPSSWGPDVVAIAGKEATKGILSFHEVDKDADVAETQAFRQKFVADYGDEPTLHAYLAYDAVYVIAQLLEECDSDSACIKDGLYDVDFDGASGRVRFDDNGDVVRDGAIMKEFDGEKFVTV